MLVLQLYNHVPLRARLTYLAVFLLCLYCCPSVLYMAFFFALVARITDQGHVAEVCWTLSVFFLLWWFRPLVSLLPILVYVAADRWHARLSRLNRQANNNSNCFNTHSGGNDVSQPNYLQQVCSSVGTFTTANAHFASVTSGFATLNNYSTVVRESSRALYNSQVCQRFNDNWVSRPFSFLDDHSLTSASGESISFDSSFSNLITLIRNGMYYIGTSTQVNSLVSGMETLSLKASSLTHASLVRVSPIDDNFNDGSGDRSSLTACRCNGTGRTSRGSCSCLGHVCSGPRCVCLSRGESTRGPYFNSNGNNCNPSQPFSGLARCGVNGSRWFFDVMVSLQDRFSHLTLGSGEDSPATELFLRGSNSTSDNYYVDHCHTEACNKAGVSSLVNPDFVISEELSAMVTNCLSIGDKHVNDKELGGDAEISHSNYDSTGDDRVYDSSNTKMYPEGTDFGDRSTNSRNDGGYPCDSGSDTDDLLSVIIVPDNIRSGSQPDGSDVEISHLDQGLLHDVDASSTRSDSSSNDDVYGSHDHHNNLDIENNGLQGSTVDDQLQSETGSLRSWEINGSDYSSVSSPLYSQAIDDYEENYNPFDTDDDGSSTGTAPLYTGTAVFNDESAFGTF